MHMWEQIQSKQTWEKDMKFFFRNSVTIEKYYALYSYNRNAWIAKRALLLFAFLSLPVFSCLNDWHLRLKSVYATFCSR